MNEIDKAKLRALMYDNSGDPVTRITNGAENAFKISYSGNKTTTISIDGKEIIIPNPSYVTNLEQQIIAQHRKTVKLTNTINSLKHNVAKQNDDINKIWRELNNKMNMRD